MIARRAAVLVALLLGFGVGGARAAPAADSAGCWPQTFEDSGFIVCRYSPGRDDLRLASQAGGAPIDNLLALQRHLGRAADRVVFAMNAGMYGTDQKPLGLFVQDGRTLKKLDRGHGGGGNFYLRPNGVFWVGANGAPHIDETSAYADKAPAARWATQSGPLLVKDGALHPAVTPDGPSRYVRNAVGIRGREALFVISDGLVSFGKLARFMRDDLGCPDVLYLDGSVSSLWAPSLGRQDTHTGLGTFVVVIRRQESSWQAR